MNTDHTIALIGGGAGAATGYITSKISIATAQAAVKVRPGLADATWLEAMLTSHFSDWLFYNHPSTGTAITVIFMTLIVAVAAWSIE